MLGVFDVSIFGRLLKVFSKRDIINGIELHIYEPTII